MVNSIFYITCVLLECIKLIIVYTFIFAGILSKDIRRYLVSLAGVIIIITADELVFFSKHYGLLLPVLMSFIFFMITQGKRKFRVYSLISSYCIINIIDNMMIIIVENAFINQSINFSDKSQKMMMEAIWMTVYIFISIISYKRVKMINKDMLEKERRSDIGIREILISIVCVIACFFVVAGTQILLSDGGNHKLKVVISIGSMVMCIAVIMLVYIQNYFFNAWNIYSELLDKSQQYQELKDNYYYEQYDKFQNISKINHDFKKHLIYIYEIIQKDDEKAKSYIEQLIDLNNKVKTNIDCGNVVANAMLNGIYQKCITSGIEFKCEGHINNDLTISDMDLCILLGNILDNAYEASAAIDGNGGIDIQFSYYEDKIIITQKNKCLIERTGMLMHSSKKESGHGYGMKNIYEVVSRYGGTVSWKIENYLFQIDVYI